jgi:hypothetical protein
MYDEDELEEMSVSELKQLIVDEFEEEAPKTKKKSALVEFIMDLQSSDDDEDEDEDEDEDDEDYSDWDLSDLKAELKSRGLKTAGKKSALITRLEESDEEDGPYDE